MKREYLALSQDFFEDDFYKTIKFDAVRAFQDLISTSHSSEKEYITKNKGKKFKAQRGQTWVSKRHLASKWHWDRKTVKSYLIKMENANKIKVEPVGENGKYGCLITIINFNKYVKDGSTEVDPEIDAEGYFNSIDKKIAESTKNIPIFSEQISTFSDTVPTNPESKQGKFPPNNFSENKKDKKTNKIKEIKEMLFVFKKEGIVLGVPEEVEEHIKNIQPYLKEIKAEDLRKYIYFEDIPRYKEINFQKENYRECFIDIFGEPLRSENNYRAIFNELFYSLLREYYPYEWIALAVSQYMEEKERNFGGRIKLEQVNKIDNLVKCLPKIMLLSEIEKLIFQYDNNLLKEFENDPENIINILKGKNKEEYEEEDNEEDNEDEYKNNEEEDNEEEDNEEDLSYLF